MSEVKYKEEDKKFFQVSEDDFSWKSCMFCRGEITQLRKAFFKCINCNQEFIADEEDMRR